MSTSEFGVATSNLIAAIKSEVVVGKLISAQEYIKILDSMQEALDLVSATLRSRYGLQFAAFDAPASIQPPSEVALWLRIWNLFGYCAVVRAVLIQNPGTHKISEIDRASLILAAEHIEEARAAYSVPIEDAPSTSTVQGLSANLQTKSNKLVN